MPILLHCFSHVGWLSEPYVEMAEHALLCEPRQEPNAFPIHFEQVSSCERHATHAHVVYTFVHMSMLICCERFDQPSAFMDPWRRSACEHVFHPCSSIMMSCEENLDWLVKLTGDDPIFIPGRSSSGPQATPHDV